MSLKKILETTWNSNKQLLTTRISGNLEKADIDAWENSLNNALGQIPDNTRIKVFVDMHGFKAVDIDAHKRFRNIIPLILADYGWKVGYLGLFEEEAKLMKFGHTRGIKCVAVAHSHQDETKMDLYESRFSSDREHFFADPQLARDWIDAVPIDED